MEEKPVRGTGVEIRALGTRDQSFSLVVVLGQKDPEISARLASRKADLRDLGNGPDLRQQAHNRRHLVHLLRIRPGASGWCPPTRWLRADCHAASARRAWSGVGA